MNSEAPYGPPAPQRYHDDAATIAIILFIAVVAALVLHHFLKSKSTTMTDHDLPQSSPSDDLAMLSALASTQPARSSEVTISKPAWQQGAVAVGMAAAPPETSVNDVHLLREQDQALSQLAVQYEDMIRPPWSYEAITQIPDIAAGTTHLGRKTQALGAMSMPISAAGSQRGTSARGTLWFMNVGANKVSASSDAACKAIHKRINDEYFAIVAEHRKAILQQIGALAGMPAAVPSMSTIFHTAKCGQTRVAFDTQEEAEGMAEKLNASYAAIVKPEIDRVLSEIATEAARRP